MKSNSEKEVFGTKWNLLHWMEKCLVWTFMIGNTMWTGLIPGNRGRHELYGGFLFILLVVAVGAFSFFPLHLLGYGMCMVCVLACRACFMWAY